MLFIISAPTKTIRHVRRQVRSKLSFMSIQYLPVQISFLSVLFPSNVFGVCSLDPSLARHNAYYICLKTHQSRIMFRPACLNELKRKYQHYVSVCLGIIMILKTHQTMFLYNWYTEGEYRNINTLA